jgi:hypothetical protein
MGLLHSPLSPTDGLVLCLDSANRRSYPGSGNTWFDLSGNGNDGTLTNGASYNGFAMNFDGVNDSILLPVGKLPSGNPSFTLSLWVIPKNQGAIISWGRAGFGAGYQFGLFYFTSSKIFAAGFDDGKLAYNDISSDIDKVTHVVVVKTPGNIKTTTSIYINGITKPNTSTDELTPTIGTIWAGIGRWGFNSFPDYISMNLFDVSIFNRSLSPAEIRALFNARRRRYGL